MPGKGRPSGGLIVAFNCNLYTCVKYFIGENFIAVHLEVNECDLLVIACYIRKNQNLQDFFEEIETPLRYGEGITKKCHTFMIGDFNSRVTLLNSFGLPLNGFSCKSNRESLDKNEDKRGREFCQGTESKELIILNGRIEGDIPASFTYIDKKGCSTIDLCCCKIENLEIIKKFQTLEIVSASDHVPISVVIQIQEQMKIRENVKKLKWRQEKKDEYVKEMKKVSYKGNGWKNVNELNKVLVDGILTAAEKSGMYKVPKTLERVPNGLTKSAMIRRYR